MPTRDPRIDAFIVKAQPFAKPILRHLRSLVHAACPDVEETMKWGMPHFDYRGAMMCSMAAFKAHAVFGFWHGAELLGKDTRNAEAMGDFGRITSVGDLPSDATIKRLIRSAMRLNEAGVKRRVAYRKPAPKAPPRTPPALAKALAKVPAAKAQWSAFAPSHKREYAEWITEARTDATRDRRVAQAVAWIGAGKQRNWKYQRPKAS